MTTDQITKIEEITKQIVDYEVGLDCASVVVKHDGHCIDVISRSNNSGKTSHKDPEESRLAYKSAVQEWSELGEAIRKSLTSAGVDYVVEHVTRKSVTLWFND
jgi:hypothetical protein